MRLCQDGMQNTEQCILLSDYEYDLHKLHLQYDYEYDSMSAKTGFVTPSSHTTPLFNIIYIYIFGHKSTKMCLPPS